ncbi:hypothetical protein LCGC14_0392410 [marine sediment metagenome]|uniref:Uncharacterized protein n=1 Tax=marine sediment metagenome TaxID=412755 RepID=A0A0F9THD7_9ZZZZ
MAVQNGLYETATGDLLAASTGPMVAGAGETLRADVPAPAKTRGDADETNMHRWVDPDWTEVAQPATIIYPLGVPIGTTTQRDETTPFEGALWCNTTTNQLEQYLNAAWSAVGGGGGGDLVLIETQTAVGVSSVDFTDLTTYKNFLLVIQKMTWVNNFSDIWLRVQTGGSTWEADASDYQHTASGATQAGANIAEGSGGNTRIQLNLTQVSNQLADVGQFRIFFGEVDDAVEYKQFTWIGTYEKAAGNGESVSGGGQFKTAIAITGVRILQSAGNISGVFKLYGMN